VHQHVTVYREAGRYAGWPANYGIWSWGDEIVVGFTVGHHSNEGGFHARDRTKPFVAMQARSLDGGVSWEVSETPCKTPFGRGLSADEHVVVDPDTGTRHLESAAFETPDGTVDFTHPDFALMCARTGLTAGARSWYYTSTDRCRSWQGPYALPDFGTPGIAARTDYIVWGPRECSLFLTAAKRNGQEGHVFCARTADGGKSFALESWIGPEPKGFAIMPATVRLGDSEILVALRRREKDERTNFSGNFIDTYRSLDRGATWSFVDTPVKNTGNGGNPPTLTRLGDGRLCMTYGFRDAPYGMRAVVSEDGGKTWGPEIRLRSDGGNHDVGYPRTVARADGKLVTVYYYTDRADSERYIAATIWEA